MENYQDFLKKLKNKKKMEEGEALYIKVLPEGHVGVKFFNGKEWIAGRIFPHPWHKIMGYFDDIDDLKDCCLYEESSLKVFKEEVAGVKDIYKEITKMMYNHFSKGSSVEHCKGYILDDVLDLFEKKFPNLKRMTPEEYRKDNPFFIDTSMHSKKEKDIVENIIQNHQDELSSSNMVAVFQNPEGDN